VHQLYEDPGVIEAVVERWGPDVAPDGVVDRSAIARRAFADDDERLWLEGLLWPRVGTRMMAWREEESGRVPAPKALVVEVPLLFEAGMEGAFEATVAVVADEEVRARRAGERGHEVLDERSARQLTQEEKAELADHVVANSGTIQELEQTLSELLEKLRATPA
jgi:dephospho-CoA kinase